MLKFYYDLMSQPARALYLFLKCNNIPYEDCKIAIRNAEHTTEEYAKVNPFKRVPAIVHNDFNLSESVAIVRYLERQFDVADHWYPKDAQSRAKVDEFLEWQHLNLRLYGTMMFQEKFLFPWRTKKPINQKRFEFAEKNFKRVLDDIENVFLAEGPFIGGRSEFSVADVFCACEIEQPIAIGFDGLSDYPRITTWMKLLKDRLNPEYDKAHFHIHAFPETLKTLNL